MKKQNIILTISLLIVSICVPLLVSSSGYLDKNLDVSQTNEISIIEQMVSQVLVEENEKVFGNREAYNDEIKEQLEVLKKKGQLNAGEYLRQEAIIRGMIDVNARRLDLVTANEIIASGSSIDEIILRFNEVHSLPDFAGGTDYSTEYWLDENGDKKIIVSVDIENISLHTLSEDGATVIETLYAGLSEEEIEQLKIIREKGERGAGIFWWQEAVIRGMIDVNARRLDVATAKEIIVNSSSFKEILARFEEVQPYPDFGGGSGYSRLEYWLDEKGEEKIIVSIEYEGITLITLSEDGSRDIEELYVDIYER